MTLLPWTFLLPLAGTLILSLSRGRLSPRASSVVGVTSVGLAALVAAWVGWRFLASGETSIDMTLWTWVTVGDFRPTIGLHLDGLSLTLMGIITTNTNSTMIAPA